MKAKDIQAAKLKMVQDAIEQVRRMGDDPPNRKERRKGRTEAALTDLEGDSDILISVSKP